MTKWKFNSTIRQWGSEHVLPIPLSDVKKLKILTEKNTLVGERANVEVEL